MNNLNKISLNKELSLLNLRSEYILENDKNFNYRLERLGGVETKRRIFAELIMLEKEFSKVHKDYMAKYSREFLESSKIVNSTIY